MSYTISNVKYSPLLSKQANDYHANFFSWVNPNEKLFSDLQLPLKNLKITPFIEESNLCQHFLESGSDFDIRSDDVFVCSLAKCGSSVLQTIVWLLMHNLDYQSIQSVKREQRFGDLEARPVFENIANKLIANDSSKTLSESDALKMAFHKCLEALKSPRVIKTHLPIYALPKKIWPNATKVIYICRSMKDMVVSEYHFWRNYFCVDITMDDVVNGVTNNIWLYSNHIDNILNFWNVRHLPNLLFITYEDLVADSFAMIKKISQFLECEYTDAQLKELTEYTSFEKMKKNQQLNREADIVRMEETHGKKRLDSTFSFLRKGKAGTYRDDLNEDQIRKLDEWTECMLKDTDFRFKE